MIAVGAMHMSMPVSLIMRSLNGNGVELGLGGRVSRRMAVIAIAHVLVFMLIRMPMSVPVSVATMR